VLLQERSALHDHRLVEVADQMRQLAGAARARWRSWPAS
jgi:hypothetical protein